MKVSLRETNPKKWIDFTHGAAAEKRKVGLLTHDSG
jgi:hypothetical protein